ncbi:MAG: Hsp20/alpha crystallin family protein [Cyclobacteriaceae bacterium]|nr:Hsp20/alpha crystallin family protein [Cyclobacteriaceae bacterium]
MKTIQRRKSRTNNFLQGFRGEDLVEDFPAKREYDKKTHTFFSENPLYYYIEVHSQGMESDDFDVHLETDQVSIYLSPEEDHKISYIGSEQKPTVFHQDKLITYRLPKDADIQKSTARFHNSRLMLLVPRENDFEHLQKVRLSR